MEVKKKDMANPEYRIEIGKETHFLSIDEGVWKNYEYKKYTYDLLFIRKLNQTSK